MPPVTNIAIVDSLDTWRNSLEDVFNFLPHFVVAYSSADYEHAATVLSRGFDGIVIFGIAPGQLANTKLFTRILTDSNRNCKIVVTVPPPSLEEIIGFLSFGLSGIALRDSSISELVGAAEDVARGGAFFSPAVSAKLISIFRRKFDSPLSGREIQVLSLMAKGMSYTVIAESLFISKTTVKAHMRNIYSKLQVNDKAAAIDKANKEKIISGLR